MDYFEAFGIDVGKGKYYEEVIYGVALLYNIINNEISTHLGQFDLTSAKFNVLMVIKHQGGKQGVSQVEISKRLVVTASNMTRLIDKLEKERLIERFAQEGDRRVNIIRITEKGSTLLDKAWPGYVERLKKLMSDLKEEDQKALSNLIRLWLAVLTR